MTPDKFNDTILGKPVKWNDTMPKEVVANAPPILFGSWYPPDREFDAETLDGHKIKIKVRYVVKFSEDTE